MCGFRPCVAGQGKAYRLLSYSGDMFSFYRDLIKIILSKSVLFFDSPCSRDSLPLGSSETFEFPPCFTFSTLNKTVQNISKL